MVVEFYYQAFMLVRESSHILRMTIMEDETLMYRLVFLDENECSNFIRLLHHYAMEMEESAASMSKQSKLVKQFIHSNPLDYEYQLYSID